MEEAARDFLPQPENVAEARRWSRTLLSRWGLDDNVDAVDVIISELVQNAFEHAQSPCRLLLTHDGRCLRIEAHDASPAPPRHEFTEGVGGWGLQLVNSLADAWGVRSSEHDKIVWASLDCVSTPARRPTSDSP